MGANRHVPRGTPFPSARGRADRRGGRSVMNGSEYLWRKRSRRG
jgi:hypothetical protein